jgi:hypothetical protein
LGSWVDLEDLAEKATTVSLERLRPPKKEPRETNVGGDATTTPQIYKAQMNKRAAIEAIQSLVKKRARSMSVSTLQDTTPTTPVDTAIIKIENDNLISRAPSPATPILPEAETKVPDTIKEVQATDLPDAAGELFPEPTADNILETVRTQYFETLYKSMVCVPLPADWLAC